MNHNSAPFVSLLLILGIAVAAPLLANRLRRIAIPIVVVEILAGIVIGQSGFNLVETSAVEEFLAEFGFTLLMFLSGLEIDFSLLRSGASGTGPARRWRSPLAVGVGMFVLTLGLALGGSFGLRQVTPLGDPVLMALILSTTSLGVVVPVLKERRLETRPYGQYILVAATVADFATLLLLTVFVAAISGGLTLDLLLILVLLAGFGLFARLGRFARRWGWLQHVMEDLSHATGQLRVRGAFALMVAWVVLAEALGAEVILGAFMAGALISLLGGAGESQLRDKLDAIGYGFFIPIFFILVGANFRVESIFGSDQALLVVAVLLILALLVKLVPAMLLRTMFTARETLAAGFLLSARLSLIIAASAIALDLGAISEAINADVILVAIISVSVAPVVFNRLVPPSIEQARRGMVIVGADPLAELLVRRLVATGEQVTMTTTQQESAQLFERAGARVVVGAGSLEERLTAAGAGQAQAMVILEGDAEEVMYACELGRSAFDLPTLVARATDVAQVARLQAMGVRAVQSTLATAMALEGALRFPTAFDVLAHQAEGVEVAESELRNPVLAGLAVRQLNLPGDALLLTLTRGDEVTVPHGDDLLRLGDRLSVVGSPDAVKQAIQLMEPTAGSFT